MSDLFASGTIYLLTGGQLPILGEVEANGIRRAMEHGRVVELRRVGPGDGSTHVIRVPLSAISHVEETWTSQS